MFDQLRRPFFFVALALIVVIVLVELASLKLVGLNSATDSMAAALDAPTPGFGIPYLAILDGLVLYSISLIAVSLLLPEAIHARLQGIATLIVSLLWLLLAFIMTVAAIGLLVLMVSLLVAPIFGTIAYFVIYADFDRDSAAVTLSLLTALKIGFAVCLFVAQQRFLQNKGLVVIIAISLLANMLLVFLHGLVPSFLVSITDMLGAVIIAILALIWALVFLVGSVISIFKAVV
jgi:hypothetical protein